MEVQSLLFSRAEGWTTSKAKQWAKSHGYKHGKVDVTDQYIRLRQFDPKGLKVKRTKTFGHGIKAIVAREEIMANTTKEAARRRRRPARKAREAAKEAPRRRRRTTREAPAVKVAAPRRRRRRTTREAAPAAVAAPRRRRRRAARETSHVMEAPRPRRRRRRATSHRTREAWHGNRPGHRKAAKKGWERRKRRRVTREPARMAEAPRRRRRKSRRTREEGYVMEARRPRRRRARHMRAQEVQAPRRRRRSAHRRSTHEAPRRYRRHARRSNPFSGAELAIAIGTGALGFVAADFLDRFLATYDPTDATKPTDRFTSDGAGTLANTLNVASRPGLVRGGAAVAMAVVPLVGSLFIDQPYVRSSLEGFGIGAAINAVKLLVNNVIMPLLSPKDTSTAGLQKSFIARLYPAEIAASINMAAAPTAGQPAAVSSSGSGALSGADVGPFALSAESPYPSAAEALRHQAGMASPGGNFPSLQNVWGTGDFPTAAQAMGVGAAAADATHAVMAALPGIPPSAAAQAAGAAIAHPHNIHGALVMVLPHVPVHVLMECARQVAPHVARVHAAAASTPVATAPVPPAPPVPGTAGLYGVGQTPPPATGAPMATPLTAVPVASVPVGPLSLPIPGPRMNSPEHAPEGCACLSDDNPFLGFVGDAEEETLFSTDSRAA